MGKKIKISISIDKKLITDLDKLIEKHSLSNRSHFINQWSKTGFEQLKKDLGIPEKREIAISKG